MTELNSQTVLQHLLVQSLKIDQIRIRSHWDRDFMRWRKRKVREFKHKFAIMRFRCIGLLSYNYLPNQWIVLLALSDWLLKLGIVFVFQGGAAKVVSKMASWFDTVTEGQILAVKDAAVPENTKKAKNFGLALFTDFFLTTWKPLQSSGSIFANIISYWFGIYTKTFTSPLLTSICFSFTTCPLSLIDKSQKL